MKKMVVVTLLFLIVGSALVFAAPIKTGLGVGPVIGFPFHIGVTGEYNFGPAYASLDLGYETGAFMLRAGGGYNFPTPFVNSEWPLDLYLSVGGRVGLAFNKWYTGVSIDLPVTWTWYLDNLPLKIFVSAAPSINIPFGVWFVGSAGAMWVFDLSSVRK